MVIIVTVPIIIDTWLRGQAKYLSKFYDIKIITSFCESIPSLSLTEGVEIVVMDITPKITPIRDLKTIYKMYTYFTNQGTDIVYVYTPKAALVGMMSAFFARVPLRINNIVSLRMMEASGIKKIMYRATEYITCTLSNRNYCNSFGLRDFVNQNIIKKNIDVIGNGSVNGVDSQYFKNSFSGNQILALRRGYSFEKENFIIIYVGRVVKDKGVDELIEAFQRIEKIYDDVKLFILGDYQSELDPVKAETFEYIENSQNVIHVSHKKDIRPYLAMSDVLILPSYREGLPNILIEAGSFGMTIVATNINGCNEVITHEKNGILIEPKSSLSIYRSIKDLYCDRKKIVRLSDSIRESIIKRYEQKEFYKLLKDSIGG